MHFNRLTITRIPTSGYLNQAAIQVKEWIEPNQLSIGSEILPSNLSSSSKSHGVFEIVECCRLTLIPSPSESLILDLEDAHLEDVFTNEELKEIEETGAPIIREVPASVGEILSELGKLVRQIDYA